MPRDKGYEWQHVIQVDEANDNATKKDSNLFKLQCIYCGKTFTGGILRIRGHLGGSSAIKKCENVPESVSRQISVEEEERIRSKALKRKRNALDIASECGSKPLFVQPTFPAMLENASQQQADAALARFFYVNGIPFAAADSKYFKEALRAVSLFGPNYKPPGREELSETLLQEEVCDVTKKLEKFKNQMSSTGGTLVIDGWTSVQNRSIINLLLVTAEGSVFLDAVDVSGKTKDAKFIADILAESMEAVGPENIVQVVSDSAANCVAGRNILAGRYPDIVFSPCSAYCLDLLLEDIGNLQWVAHIISQGRDVVEFVTTHQASLAFFRNHCELELLKPDETRFAKNCVMLQRLRDTKDNLQETVACRAYKQWLSNTTNDVKGSRPKVMLLLILLKTIVFGRNCLTFYLFVNRLSSCCV